MPLDAVAKSKPEIVHSACPHDCPSTCALEVEVLDGRSIGRVRGAEANRYTVLYVKQDGHWKCAVWFNSKEPA